MVMLTMMETMLAITMMLTTTTTKVMVVAITMQAREDLVKCTKDLTIIDLDE